MMKTIALILLALCTALFLWGCAGSDTTALTDKEIDTFFAQRLSCPELSPVLKPDQPICTDYTDKGLLRICYTKESDVKIKLQVLCGGNHIEYNLKADGSIEDFSLQYGSGEYTARILQNKTGNEYIEVLSRTFNVSLRDETIAFLNSIQNVNWSYNMEPIKNVRKIIAPSLAYAKDSKLLEACLSDLYNYVCENVSYDNDKFISLDYDYVPDIEQIFSARKGICYDYASLFAAMLRSIGIPTKIVKGYANYNPDVYHAWNEVYLDGAWHVIDTTLDSTAKNYDSMFKDAADYTKSAEY